MKLYRGTAQRAIAASLLVAQDLQCDPNDEELQQISFFRFFVFPLLSQKKTPREKRLVTLAEQQRGRDTARVLSKPTLPSLARAGQREEEEEEEEE